MPARSRRDPDEASRRLPLILTGAACLVALVGLALGSLPTKVVVCVTAGAAVQGLWAGAATTLGAFVGMAMAAVLAPHLGRLAEGMVAGLMGTTGLENRLVSALLAGAVVLVVFGGLGSLLSRRFIRLHPRWRQRDRLGGGAIGLVEGLLLSMMLLWAPLALEPVARVRLSVEAADPAAPPSRAARRVAAMAEAVRGSTLGRVAAATNPIAGSSLLVLCEEFALVARDEEALRRFLDSPVMQEIRTLPSVARAREIIERDTALVESFRDREAITAQTVRRVMESDMVLRAIDATTVVRDLSPRADEIAAALRAARGGG